MTYSTLLRLPQWQRKRLEVMFRDGFRCVSCGADHRTLNVHHKRYIRGHRPWEYDHDNLETLCEPCHESKHWPGDIDLSRLSDDEVRDFLAWSIEQEDAADSDRIERYHAAKQEQAWTIIFRRKEETCLGSA